MRRILMLSLSFALLAAGGCASKPKNGECKSGDDCKAQTGYGAICVEGRCQECGADTDCQAGFVCKTNKCTPRPECAGDADCGSGKACQDGRCLASAPKPECDGDAACGSGQACQAGKCVAKVAEAAPAEVCGGEDNAVHFGFDKSDLDATARGTLAKVAECVKGQKGVVIEGHCDQRGTTEYNLHLGQRRADAVRKYLRNLGVDGKSLKSTSYGKERPLCNDENEDCWAKNRRGVVVVSGNNP